MINKLIDWRLASSRDALVINTGAEKIILQLGGYQCLLLFSNLCPPSRSRVVVDSPDCQTALTNKGNLSSRVVKKQNKRPRRPRPPDALVSMYSEVSMSHRLSIYGLNNVETPDILQSHLADGLLLQLRHTGCT